MAVSRRDLSLEIHVLGCDDPHPIRKLVLKSPTYAVRIGRGSKSSNTDLCPAGNNAWFDNRVMSREHAVIKADPDTHYVYIEDVGSMHGTHLANRLLPARERHSISDEDSVIFGSEVTRGPDSFLPLRVCVRLVWMNDSSGKRWSALKNPQRERPSNIFQVPDIDDDEEDDDDDDEISFVQETVIAPKLELVTPDQAQHQHELILPYVREAPSCLQRTSGVDLTPLTPHASRPGNIKEVKCETKQHLASSFSEQSHPPKNLTGVEADRQADRHAAQRQDSFSAYEGRSTSPGLQMLAASHVTPPISFQSDTDQEHILPKDGAPGIEQSSIQVVAVQREASVIEGNLTPSESSSEISSPGLMVDDSEDEPTSSQIDPATSPAEEQMVAAIQPCERFADDYSIDSEGTDSVFDQDFDNDCGEDLIDCAEFEERYPRYSVLAEGFQGGEKHLGERDKPVPCKMNAGDPAALDTRLKPAPQPLNRAPSPSDAAMMKSSDFAAGIPDAQGTPYQDVYPASPNWVNPLPLTPSCSWQYAFDGRQQLPYSDNLSVAGTQHLAASRYIPKQYPPFLSYTTLGANTAMFDRSSTQPDHFVDDSDSHAQWQPQPEPKSTPEAVTEITKDTIAAVQSSAPSATAKVSIDSIVDHAPSPAVQSKDNSRLKRKASVMDNSGVPISLQEVPPNSMQEADTHRLIITRKLEKSPIFQPEAVSEIVSIPAAVGARPAKRARVSGKREGPGFATLAATALVGAIVGGVGVVAALVSLPPDFFV